MNAPAHLSGRSVEPPGRTASPKSHKRDSRPARAKGSPMLIVLMMIVVLPSVLLADHWGAGAAGIIGGLTGMFSLVAFMGGPLRPDLRVAAVLGPLLVVAAAVPRLVAEASRPAAIALVVLLTFVAALLPLVGARFANAGMGLGMTTMFGYGYAPMGGADHRQVFAAAIAGVVVALLLRILMGIADPSKPTREQVAAVLVADDVAGATATAFSTWLSDGRQRWLADSLEAASDYRLAVRAAQVDGLAADDVAGLRARAEELAGELRAKPGRDKGGTADTSGEDAATAAVGAPAPRPVPSATDGPLADAVRALDTIERAVRERDTTPVELERTRRHELQDALLHPSARLTSIQLRHALRTALAVLLMLIITSGLERGDPLVSTSLLATFSILQASWSDTATKTRNKIVGVVAGSLTVAVVLLVVPSDLLVAVAAISLCLGLWYVVTRPALGNAFMVVVSVGFNSVSRDLDPVALLVQYVGLTASAVLVGVVLGFTVIPRFRPAPLRRRIETAAEATATALRASSDGSRPMGAEVITLFRDAARTQDDLVPDREDLDERQRAELDTLRTVLGDLTVLAGATDLARDEVDRVVRALSPEGTAAPGAPTVSLPGDERTSPTPASSTLWELAQQAGSAERYLLETLPAGA
ncbi:FUSC family protein [Nocardioides sp. zg-1228]|uniref:FUSC family protein n=1 Tax=Nocardioides sp. zg-1228 TaxID=2763008 RepID=UPI001642A1ED|nr:FUSC family protein [Nocardioides sp. zg-1228]MBC2933142.1 hypothetical protein [Nocardioides sp. zg-1228]QSF56675.1 hypothetical protein JX575_13785 [Nocardioides sp. zg-1228]